tara:strand:- start:780 stop:1427 length:648 start_codon:yes stop_codon:yes gene_type:complete
MKLPKKPLKKNFLKERKEYKQHPLPWYKQDITDLDKILAREIDIKKATKKEMQYTIVSLEGMLRTQQKTIYNACEEIRHQRSFIRILNIEGKKNEKKVNGALELQAVDHDATVFILRDKIEKLEENSNEWYLRDKKWKRMWATRERTIKKFKRDLENAYSGVLKKHKDCLKKNKVWAKAHDEVMRAYIGIIQFGKKAEDYGVDVDWHTRLQRKDH